jgi:APA family basic amino acid/polyamine antiporter
MADSNKKQGVSKSLSVWDYFHIGFGAMVGIGWVLMVGDWVVSGGGPLAAMVAFLLGGLALLPIGAAFGELATAMPISGGIVEYVDKAFGKKTSFLAGWLLAFGDGIVCPWEALMVSTIMTELVSDYWPWLKSIELYEIFGSKVYLWPVVFGLLMAGYVIWQNFRGISSMARLQSFFTRMLLLGMTIAMIISFVKGSPDNFLPLFQQVTGPATETGGSTFWTAMLSVLVLTPYFYTGLDTIPDQAEEAEEGINWKSYGRVIGITLIVSAIFYDICIYSFSTIIPWTEFIRRPIPALAVLKDINIYLAVSMLAIATLGPLGPMNSLFSATARILLAMGRKRQLPKSFARLDKRGTPKTANCLLAALTLAGPFLGYHMVLPLTEIAGLAFILPCTMVTAACYKFRNDYPELKRPYSVPGGKVGIAAGVLIGSLICGLMIVPFSPVAIDLTEWVILGGWLLLGAVLYRKSEKELAREHGTN